MCFAQLGAKDALLLLRVLVELARRGIFPWVLGGDPLVVGIEGRGRLLVPLENLRANVDRVVSTVEFVARGGSISTGGYQFSQGSGEFPEDGWTDLELAWLRFQRFLVQRGAYDEDHDPRPPDDPAAL